MIQTSKEAPSQIAKRRPPISSRSRERVSKTGYLAGSGKPYAVTAIARMLGELGR